MTEWANYDADGKRVPSDLSVPSSEPKRFQLILASLPRLGMRA